MKFLQSSLFRALSVLSLVCTGCLGHSSEFGLLQEAEQLSREGKYDQAIEAYRTHMQHRLELKTRPEWENPYFYLILIGDIQLGRAQPEEAERSYLEAENNKVDSYLVSDRFRGIARWYEQKGQLTPAIKILERYRARDPLLFESMLDRLAKELTAQEDALRTQH